MHEQVARMALEHWTAPVTGSDRVPASQVHHNEDLQLLKEVPPRQQTCISCIPPRPSTLCRSHSEHNLAARTALGNLILSLSAGRGGVVEVSKSARLQWQLGAPARIPRTAHQALTRTAPGGQLAACLQQ